MRILSLLLLAGSLGVASSSASAPSNLQGYGLSVATDGGLVFVGEPTNTMRPGVVYVYGQSGDEWIELARLEAEDSSIGDGFGTAIAARDGRLLVSSSQAGGTVYVFDHSDEGSWVVTGRLAGAEGEGFGASLSFDGDRAVVGAPGAGNGSGAVYVFRGDGANWTLETRIAEEGLVEGDGFGTAVVVSGEHLLVGAPNRDSRAGAAYAYLFGGESWDALGQLSARDIAAGSRLATSIALSEGQAVVGAPMHAGSVGAVLQYTWDDEGGWIEAGQLVPFSTVRGLRFGSSVALTDKEVWVGTPGANGWTGGFHVFSRLSSTDSWSGVAVQRSASSARGSGFGGAVALSAEVAVAGLPGADGGSGLALVFEAGPHAGAWIETASLMGPVEGLDSATGSEMRCVDGKAGDFECERMDLLSFMPIRDMGGERATNLNDIWGWTDPETGREYAIVGRTDGTSFVDISDPVNPIFVGDLPKTDGSRSASWRDMKVYADHVFVVADGAGQHGMQVMDLARLRGYGGEPLTFDEDFLYDRIASAHNVVINTDTGFAYTVGNSQGGETCGGGLHMIDIRTPKEPSFAGCFGHEGTGRAGTGYNHDAQCVVYHGPDEEHRGREICFGSAETALSIADVTDRDNPRPLSAASYPNVSYSHQGWISEDHRHFYMNDELDEVSGKSGTTRTLIWDVTDLDDPQLIKEHFSEQKASDHNLYIRGNFMYQSNYMAGLRVLDITDPANPVEVGYFDTTPFSRDEAGFDGSWSNYPFFESGAIIVSSIREGLFVLRQQQIDL